MNEQDKPTVAPPLVAVGNDPAAGEPIQQTEQGARPELAFDAHCASASCGYEGSSPGPGSEHYCPWCGQDLIFEVVPGSAS
jgi:hypothetical protein